MNVLFTPEMLIFIFSVVGLIVGSFLNVVIYRLPLMIMHEGPEPGPNLCFPGSHCPSCGNALRWYHNVPVLSYALLRGKCGWCKTKISARYPLVEALTALVWVGCLFFFGSFEAPHELPLVPLFWAVMGSMFIAMVFIDMETMLLPDALTLSAMWLAIFASLWTISGVTVESSLYGAAGGYLFMRGFIWVGDKVMGRPSMGQGDAKLVAVLGALFGPAALPSILLLASLSGIAIYMCLRWRNAIADGYAPFGPSLIAGGVAHALGASAIFVF
jgi:leader peptidase (prepilin peptidase)/N-methyltransferase